MRVIALLFIWFTFAHPLFAAETLPPLKNGKVPQTVQELWADYDPDKEPLEVKVLREWEDAGVTLQYITYTIGTFKGEKSTMAAFYGFPSETKEKIPALIQMHGGGQRASIDSAKYGATNGYATISLNWGGREMEGSQQGDPQTDWGAVDATQTGHNSHYGSLMPDKFTIDSVESPRNNNWFLIIIAARRAISFLQKQPIVDPNKIGAFGHSMGGKLTVMLAGADQRIKAAAPSCGGSGSAPESIRNRPNAGIRRRQSPLYHKTIDDALYVKEISCPILYVGPHNDFNGILDNMYANWQHLKSEHVNYTVTPHMNHRAIPEHSFANLLFFQSHLKNAFDFPSTPQLKVNLNTKEKVPLVTLTPDQSEKIKNVRIFYSSDPHILTRFWRSAETVKEGEHWIAKLPLHKQDRRLFVMANVYYKHDEKLVGYRWSKNVPETFGVSSDMISISPEELKQANLKKELQHSHIIEKDMSQFQDWYTLSWNSPHWWSRNTRKIKDPSYLGPAGAKLAFDIKVDQDTNFLIEVQDNNWGAYLGQKKGAFYANVHVKGAEQWQTVQLSVEDFLPVDSRTKHTLTSWNYITELGIRGKLKVEKEGKSMEVGGEWKQPRLMKNLRWEGGKLTYNVRSADGSTKVLSDEEFKRQFQDGIDDSIELEKRDQNSKP